MRPFRPPSIKKVLIQINLDIDLLYEVVSHNSTDDFNLFHEMVLILEDRRYFYHTGIDYRSFLRDLYRFITFRKHGGFSTIEMQFVRTVTGRYDKTLQRKLYEIILAHLCNWHFKKLDLLNAYLNIAYYGTNFPVNLLSDMTNIECVSTFIFGKSINDLSPEEAAEIAAYLVYPRPSRPYTAWYHKIERRKRYALRLHPHLKHIFKKIPS